MLGSTRRETAQARSRYLCEVCELPALVCLVSFLLFALAPHTLAQAEPFPGIEKIAQPELLKRIDQGAETVDVIVLLKGYKAYRGFPVAREALPLKTLQSTVRVQQNRVLSILDANEFQVRHRFENILGFSGTATLQAIEALAGRDDVKLIEEDQQVFAQTDQGIPLMEVPDLHSLGYYGGGLSVAICDTGVDYTHPDLGGAPFPNSKVIGGDDFRDPDSDPMDCNGHGTAVAGIAAGDTGGGYAGGVAPSAKIYALKIVSGCGGSSYFSTIASAWDWCVTHQYDDPDNPILVINTSFGGGRYTASCDGTAGALNTAAVNAVAAGITLFASSGNDGYCDAILAPACVTNVVSVGAVYDANLGSRTWCIDDLSCVAQYTTEFCSRTNGYFCLDSATAADQVICYSNSADFLDVLAPSSYAKTTDIAGPGGYRTGDYITSFGGTSASSPYAAGAAAVLQDYAYAETGNFLSPNELKTVMVDNGDLLTDTKSGLTHPRVNAFASANEIAPIPTSTTTSSSSTTSSTSSTSSTTSSTSSTTSSSSTTTTTVSLGDLDCDNTFTGGDVLIQASLVVELIEWTDLPGCISTWEEVLARSDWDCNGSIEGTDVLIGSSVVVEQIAAEDTPLWQGCP